MTISNTQTKQIYSGNGATTNFAIPFDFLDESEIQVYVRDETVSPATETLKVISTDYTLTGGPPVTTVVFGTAPLASTFVLIVRSVDSVQSTDYITTGTFDSEAHEQALDRLTLITQDLKEQVGRAAKLPKTTRDPDAQDIYLPEPEAGKVLGWNSTEDGLENLSGPGGGGSGSTPIIYKGTYDPTAGGGAGDPVLADGTGVNGNYYKVVAAATHDFGSGAIALSVGDWVMYNGSVWQRVPASDVSLPGALSGLIVKCRVAVTKNGIARYVDDDVLTTAEHPNEIINSNVIINDSDEMSGIEKLDVDNVRIDGNTISTTNANGDLVLTPNGTGKINLNGLLLTDTDGTVGQVLATDGAGNVAFVDQSGGSSGMARKQEIPTGVVDGVNAVFTLSAIPATDESVVVSLDGIQLLTTDWSILSNVVTLVTPPSIGQVVDVDFFTTGIIAASGYAVGAASSTDNAISRFDGVTGKVIQNSGVIISDTNQVSGVARLDVDNVRIDLNEITTTSGNLELTAFAGSNVKLSGIKFPNSDGAAGQGLVTDGAGNLSFAPVTGDMIGPAGSTDRAIVRFGDTTGKNVISTNVTLSDTGILAGLTQLDVDNLEIFGNVITATDVTGEIHLLPLTPGSVFFGLADLKLPNADGAAGQVLTTDGAGNIDWSTPSGAGDVVGPGVSVDNTVVRWDGITGQSIQGSSVAISDTDAVSGVTQLDVDNIRVDGNTVSSTNANGNVIIAPNGTGAAVIKGLTYPVADGTIGQAIVTDGAGNLSFAAAGAGDVVGPAASTDNALARFDLATGKLIQNSVAILDDAGALSGLTQLDVDNVRIDGNTVSATNVNGNLSFSPNGTGHITLSGITYPVADGTNGQVMTTNGAGVVSFQDTAPTLVAYNEIPAGAVNGANVLFTLTQTPVSTSSVWFEVDGVTLLPADWSIAGTTVTLVTAPSPGQSVAVHYIAQGVVGPLTVPTGTYKVEYRTITAPEAAAKKITLALTPSDPLTTTLDIIGGTAQEYGVDYAVSVADLDWTGLALDGVVVAGNKFRVCYFT